MRFIQSAKGTIDKKILLLVGVYLSFFVLFFFQRIVVITSYPYIRTVDTYGNIAISEAIVQNGTMPFSRPLAFPQYADTTKKFAALLGAQIHLITGIDTFIIYKFFFPLLLTLLFLFMLFSFLSQFTQAPQARAILFVILGFTLLINPSPYSLDSLFLAATPQAFALLLFFTELYLMLRYLQDHSAKKRWLTLILLVYLVWIVTHTSHFVFLPLFFISILLKERKKILTLRYLIPLSLGIGFLLYYQQNLLLWILSFFSRLATSQTISFDYIRNTLSPALVIFGLLGVALTLFRGKRWKRKNNFAYCAVFAALLFFVPIKIFPRFGLMNFVYTYRFFPFLIIALIPLFVYTFSLLIRHKTTMTNIVLISAIILLPLTWFRPQPEGGWIIGAEAEVIPFLQNSTPENSIFFTQELNGPILITARRTVFAGGNRMEENEHPATKNNLSIFYANTSEEAYKTIITSFDPDHPIYSYGSYRKATPKDRERPKYILYSKLKPTINQHWGQWWVKGSYPEAHLENFQDTKYFTKIFENSAIVVWKVNENTF